MPSNKTPRPAVVFLVCLGSATAIGLVFGGVCSAGEWNPKDRIPALLDPLWIALPVGTLLGLLGALGAVVRRHRPAEGSNSGDFASFLWALAVAIVPLLILARLVQG